MKNLLNQPLVVIFFTVFVDLIGFGIIIPIIPLLLANPRSDFFLLPKGMSLQDGYILLGFLTAMFPLGQFIATPILGQLSDRFGRKKLLLVSLAGTCIAYIIFAYGILTKNLPLLFIARAFDGITGGNISIAQAAIADITTPENRAKNFGLIGAAFGLGFILGPYIGGKLSDPSIVSWFNATTPFWFAAILSFLNIVSVFIFFPETKKQLSSTLHITWMKSITNILRGFSMKEIRIIFMTNFFFQAGFTFFTTFFSVYLINKFMFTQGNIGDFFSYVGLWVAFTQAVITRSLAGKVSESTILYVSTLGTGLAILLYFLPNVWWQLLFITPFFAIFNGLTQANIAGLISRSVSPEIQGEILGINASIQALAQSIPPILSGYIAATISPEAPIFFAAVTICVGGLIFLFFYKSTKPSFQELPVQKPSEEKEHIIFEAKT